jgi:oxygen-independent coproporphyrinogen-3 oxidase
LLSSPLLATADGLLQGTVFGTWYNTEKNGDDASEIVATSFHSTKGESPVPVSMLRLPTEEESSFMYKYAAGYLRSKGYEHYEVSSYALQTGNGNNISYKSQHNQIYWALDGAWYAFGLGATSFVNGRLIARPRTLVDYQRWVEHQTSLTNSVSQQPEVVVPDLDRLMDTVLKRLRTSDGLSLDWVQGRFGENYVNAILRGAQLGLDLNLANIDPSNTLRLVDPNGFLYSNSIISSIFVELEDL